MLDATMVEMGIIKVLSGYSANIKNLVSMKDLKLLGMKSHDCHILLTQMIPIAIRGLMPSPVRQTITKLCLFFNMIHSKVIDHEKLDELQRDIILILCQLEMYFPPSFFDVMVHLVSHIVEEIKLLPGPTSIVLLHSTYTGRVPVKDPPQPRPRRGINRIQDLSVGESVEFNQFGLAVGKWQFLYRKYIGTRTRRLISILKNNWKDVTKEEKNFLWSDIKAHFRLENDDVKKRTLVSCGNKWKAFKTKLRVKFMMKRVSPCMKWTFIQPNVWEEFCQKENTPEKNWQEERNDPDKATELHLIPDIRGSNYCLARAPRDKNGIKPLPADLIDVSKNLVQATRELAQASNESKAGVDPLHNVLDKHGGRTMGVGVILVRQQMKEELKSSDFWDEMRAELKVELQNEMHSEQNLLSPREDEQMKDTWKQITYFHQRKRATIARPKALEGRSSKVKKEKAANRKSLQALEDEILLNRPQSVIDGYNKWMSPWRLCFPYQLKDTPHSKQVAPADRLKIGKCNLRLSSDVTSKEATLQVVYDVLKLTPFYKAFQVTADAPEIYMQEFWASAYVHNRSVRFKMNNKKHILGLDQFRDILQICPKVGNKKFEEPPLEKEILAFLASLGHSGDIRKITDVNVNKLHQPWRSFAAIINKCLSGKPSYDSLRLSQAQILWGMYNKKNVDYAYLLWEDFIYQIENKNTKKGNAMYYPRFTKLVVNFVMDKDPSIPRRNKVNWHYARDDPMFTTINVISRNEDTQLYGAILPTELTNEDIRISESYKEYHAIASGKIPPKTKGSKKKADTDTTIKMKPPTVPKEKKEKKSEKGKQKATELENIPKANLTEVEQLKIIIKRSRQETHISHASGYGADEGTGVTPGVPDAPDYDRVDLQLGR
ncbi:retrovirus-related pol polyprotein from transposon TNT 1-94 [Tanacetum coccineum]